MINTDRPIGRIQDDTLDRKDFIDALTNTILDYSNKDNLVIGLSGKWGSGKTSIMNLLEESIKGRAVVNKYKYIFLRFNPWNFKEQDELIQSFFKDIYSQIHMVDWHKVKRNIESTLNITAEVLSIIGSINLRPLARSLKRYAELLHDLPFKESLEKTKNKINNKLNKFKGKLIVYIDDIDRLNDKEINQIFQLVKLLANFDNIIYILSYDHNIVKSALESSQKNHAEEYLEKIIQLPISIPSPARSKLEYKIETELKNVVGQLDLLGNHINWDRLSSIKFYKQFDSIREINRFINIFQLKYVPLREEVDPLDFALITLFEIKFREMYKLIYIEKDEFCGLGRKSSYSEARSLYKNLIEMIDSGIERDYKENKDFLIDALKYLFPKCNMAYNEMSWYPVQYRPHDLMISRLYIEEKFDLYFSLSENDLSFSNVRMNSILYKQTQEEFMGSLLNIKNEGKIDDFIVELCDKSNFLTMPRFDKIVDWIFILADDSALAEDIHKWTHQLAKMIILFYRRNKVLFTKLKDLFNGNEELSYLAIEIMILLESEHGRYYDRIILDGNIIELNELLELENLIKEKLSKQFEEKDALDMKLFKEKFCFMCNIDNQKMQNWCSIIVEDEEKILRFLIKMVNKQQAQIYGSEGLENIYVYNIDLLKQNIDVKRCYDVAYKHIKAWECEKDDSFYSVLAFLQSYDYGVSFDCTEQTLLEYYNKLS